MRPLDPATPIAFRVTPQAKANEIPEAVQGEQALSECLQAGTVVGATPPTTFAVVGATPPTALGHGAAMEAPKIVPALQLEDVYHR
jgi:hypothetical protein